MTVSCGSRPRVAAHPCVISEARRYLATMSAARQIRLRESLMPSAQSSIVVMAFDFGTRFIGVAVGQSVTGTATPLAALRARDGVPDWNQIMQLIAEWGPQQLLVGLPLNMDGSESAMSARAQKFANRLHGRCGLPVTLWDERLSSFEARGELLEQNRRSQSAGRAFRERGVDSLSARLILESWFAALVKK